MLDRGRRRGARQGGRGAPRLRAGGDGWPAAPTSTSAPTGAHVDGNMVSAKGWTGARRLHARVPEGARHRDPPRRGGACRQGRLNSSGGAAAGELAPQPLEAARHRPAVVRGVDGLQDRGQRLQQRLFHLDAPVVVDGGEIALLRERSRRRGRRDRRSPRSSSRAGGGPRRRRPASVGCRGASRGCGRRRCGRGRGRRRGR